MLHSKYSFRNLFWFGYISFNLYYNSNTRVFLKFPQLFRMSYFANKNYLHALDLGNFLIYSIFEFTCFGQNKFLSLFEIPPEGIPKRKESMLKGNNNFCPFWQTFSCCSYGKCIKKITQWPKTWALPCSEFGDEFW